MKTPVKSLMLTAAISAFAITPPVLGVVTLSTEPAGAQGASGNAGGGGGGAGGSSNAGGGGAGSGGSSNAGGGSSGGGGSSNAGGAAASGSGNGGAGNLPDQASDKAASRGALAAELKGLNAAHANPTALDNADPDSQVGRIATYRDAAQDTQDAQVAVDDILADIDALDPTDDGYDDALADLEAELADALLAYDAALADEEEALLAASNGRELSDAALAELRSLLGL